jgi:hypothetical protein
LIEFRELSSETSEFLHELSDPALVRPVELDREATIELRRQQIARLRQNITLLRIKQVEFHRKIEEYVTHIEDLIRSLVAAPIEIAAEVVIGSATDAAAVSGTRVVCSVCGSERTFPSLRVLFARESEDSIETPTVCYVSVEGRIKKGRFACDSCGEEALMIQVLTERGER